MFRGTVPASFRKEKGSNLTWDPTTVLQNKNSVTSALRRSAWCLFHIYEYVAELQQIQASTARIDKSIIPSKRVPNAGEICVPKSTAFSSESGWIIAWDKILIISRYIITPNRFSPVFHERTFPYLRAILPRLLPSSGVRCLQLSEMFHLLYS
jgi:hypothetical protein